VRRCRRPASFRHIRERAASRETNPLAEKEIATIGFSSSTITVIMRPSTTMPTRRFDCSELRSSYIVQDQPENAIMPDTITVADVNDRFAEVLAEVEAGKEFVVTREGVPVARIVPERLPDGRRRLTPEQKQALADSIARLRQGWPLARDQALRPQ
jgi:prevent-host-death family protein